MPGAYKIRRTVVWNVLQRMASKQQGPRHEGKFLKHGGDKLSALESQISQVLLDLEAGADLKPHLQELLVNEAKELELGTQKVRPIWDEMRENLFVVGPPVKVCYSIATVVVS